MDKENPVVRRVLNGPCASGRGGQVIGEEVPMAQKHDLSLGWFQSVKAHLRSFYASPTVHLSVLTTRFGVL